MAAKGRYAAEPVSAGSAPVGLDTFAPIFQFQPGSAPGEVIGSEKILMKGENAMYGTEIVRRHGQAV